MSIKNQNWIALTSIQIGGAICLPVLLIGFELAKGFGLTSALYAIVIGNALLFSFSLIGAKMSAASEMTTAENAESLLGKRVKAIFAIVLVLSMCLWFAIQAQLMATDLLMWTSFGSEQVIAFCISLFITACAMRGIKSIEILSNVAVPLMVVTMLIAIATGDAQVQTDTLSFSGISLVLAASIAAVVDMPTFFRHAKNEKHAVKASFATFMIGIPVVEALGALLFYKTDAPSLINALYCFDHTLWKGWILAFILLAGWTTNNANLYSASMSIKALFPKLSDKAAIALLGLIASLLAFCNIVGNLDLFLDVMAMIIISMGSVVFSAYLLKRNKCSLQKIH